MTEGRPRTLGVLVVALAFIATAVSTLFAQATLVRFTRDRRPQDRAWCIALALFALASAALSVGVSTGWDDATFRIFYLLGAVVNVPWLALGTVYVVAGRKVGSRVQIGVVFFSGLAAGVVFAAPIIGVPVSGVEIPAGSDVFGALPRIMAAIGSGVGAAVIFGGAVLSSWRFARASTTPGNAMRATANACIALGTIVLSSGGLAQGVAGKDQAFVASLAIGICIIYAGFVLSAAATTRSLSAETQLSASSTAISAS